MRNVFNSNKVVVLITLTLSFFGCDKIRREGSEISRNSLFDWVEPIHADKIQYGFKDVPKVKISISEEEISQSIPASEIIQDFRLLQIKNEESNFIGEVDKILFTDSLVLLLDLYVVNSLQLFDIETGAELFVFKPTGEGPGEMMTISDFDIFENRIFIYDERLAKILEFDLKGNFFRERKLPLRANSFKVIDENTYVFSSVNNPNEHLGIYSDDDILVLDSTFNIKVGFKYPLIDQRYSDFLPRDIMRFNGDLSFFPRFSNSILLVDFQREEVKNELEINLENWGLTKSDLNELNEEFIEKRKNDSKFYGFGVHFIADDWIGIKMDRFGGPEFQLFYHKSSGKYFSGTKMEFDFEDLIFFSFPLACKDNKCISVIDLEKFIYTDLDKLFSSLESSGKDYSYMRSVFESIEDFDQPLLLIFDLK